MDSGSIAASLSSVACPKVGKAQDRSLILVGSRVEWVNNIGQQWLRGAWGTDLSQMASDHAGTRAKSGFSPPLPCACAYAAWIVMPPWHSLVICKNASFGKLVVWPGRW